MRCNSDDSGSICFCFRFIPYKYDWLYNCIASCWCILSCSVMKCKKLEIWLQKWVKKSRRNIMVWIGRDHIVKQNNVQHVETKCDVEAHSLLLRQKKNTQNFDPCFSPILLPILTLLLHFLVKSFPLSDGLHHSYQTNDYILSPRHHFLNLFLHLTHLENSKENCNTSSYPIATNPRHTSHFNA